MAKTIYRDFIYINNINDYGIAGFLPSYLYVAGFSLLLLMRPMRQPAILISIVTFASVLYEVKQFSSSGLFDLRDAIASVAGGVTAFIIFRLIGHSFK
jgi:hypothetical protein